jgi:hypothetical protein
MRGKRGVENVVFWVLKTAPLFSSLFLVEALGFPGLGRRLQDNGRDQGARAAVDGRIV